MADEILWMPGDWKVGERFEIRRDGELLVGGRIKEIVGNSIYKVEVEKGGIQARRSG